MHNHLILNYLTVIVPLDTKIKCLIPSYIKFVFIKQMYEMNSIVKL